MVSYAFRECPGFFDIVTYTGTPGSPLTINHNLGSVPGCIMIKNLSSATGWAVYHRGANGGNAPYNKKLVLKVLLLHKQMITGGTTWHLLLLVFS